MFGSEYSSNPEILLSSFSDMHKKYKRISKRKTNHFLQKIYLKIFGIPEIGFQLRSLHFEKVINEKLSNKKFGKILDAGSGIGTYSIYLANKYKNAKVFGGDIDHKKIEFSTDFANNTGVKNVKFGNFNVVNPKTSVKYDFAVTIDVLEHVNDYKKVLKNFHKLLNKGGYLYIHTPQPGQKRIFKSLNKWHHEDHVHEGYTPEDLSKELNKLGFKVVYLNETFGMFGKLAWELNHISLRSGFVFAGIIFPVLYQIAMLDLLYPNHEGLGTSILARKNN